jgi:hypothetical protein
MSNIKRLFARVAIVVFVSFVMCTTLCAQDANRSIDDTDWRFSLDVSYLYGDVSGYVQTPAGGQAGTTSRHRPRFSEIGIDNASIIDAEARAGWHNEELYLGAQIVRLSGDDTLDTALITHGETFPAGTSVNADVHLDWYRFGYRHRFELLDDRSLTISPGVGGAILNFSYNLDTAGDGAPSTSRSYVKVTPQLALNAEWRPGRGPFSIELDLLGSPLVTSSIPGIFTEELLAKYRIVDNERWQLGAFVGVEFEQIRFHDDQTVPNRIEADFGPMLVVGLRIACPRPRSRLAAPALMKLASVECPAVRI